MNSIYVKVYTVFPLDNFIHREELHSIHIFSLLLHLFVKNKLNHNIHPPHFFILIPLFIVYIYTPLIHFLSTLFQCSRCCCCCFSISLPSINPRTTTPIRSFTIIINAALNTPRVNSGPIP